MASNSPDLARIKRNVAKMADAGAPESDIDGYISSEGVTVDQIREYRPGTKAQQAFAAEDKAHEQANRDASLLKQFGTGLKTQAGRTMLGIYEFANNLTGDKLMDSEVLAEAQREADRRDKGTGTAGFLGNMAGDFRNYIPVGAGAKAKTVGEAVKQAAKVGAVTGGVTGLTEATGNADSSILTNLANAAVGGTLGAGLGAAVPVAASGAKRAGSAASGAVNRTLAALGSDTAAEKVAYGNVANILNEAGYAPGQVAGIIDEFKAQGIDGGTLGQVLQSGDLLAREKNLLQGGGKAGRIMGEKLDEQPKRIAESILTQVRAVAQPEQTQYLYKQAAQLADAPTSRVTADPSVMSMGQSATRKELPFTLTEIEKDLAERADELPSAVAKRIRRIIGDAKNAGGFEAADTAKKKLDDLYKPNSQTTDQDIVNEIVLGYRRMLNDSLEHAGGDSYKLAKEAAKRDMAMRDVEDAVKGAKGSSAKTALNNFFGSMEQQEEFLRKLPDDRTRDEFRAWLENLQKVSGRFGGSDTASNTATSKRMGIETGLGVDANLLSPQAWIDRLSAPINRNVRRAQAELTFAPDADRLADAMRQQTIPPATSPAASRVLATEGAKAVVPSAPNDDRPAAPSPPTTMPPPLRPKPQPEAVAQDDYFSRLAQAESGGNPNAKAKTSTASGLYQFTDGTWNTMVGRYGKRLGITHKDKNDPEAQDAMVRLYTNDNAEYLAKLGITPNEGHLYIAHFMGAPKARKLMESLDSDQSAATLFPKEARANRSIFYDGMRARTPHEVYELLTSKMMES